VKHAHATAEVAVQAGDDDHEALSPHADVMTMRARRAAPVAAPRGPQHLGAITLHASASQ
jgi:hypothetical protein